jgi:transcriptional regulator GlxA family with amidase domain
MPHRIALLIYPDFELLDASGPASVFSGANRALREVGKHPFYAVEMISPRGGSVASSSGVEVQTRKLSEIRPSSIDTLLVAGAEAESVKAMMADPVLRRWVPRCASMAKRFGSICAGAFILASLGLLNGKRAATHWDACARLAALYPAVHVDPESVYVTDGKIWTSAGVTTGIDMALAMVGTISTPRLPAKWRSGWCSTRADPATNHSSARSCAPRSWPRVHSPK